MPATVKVSVIVSTYNGRDKILNVLKCIERQLYVPYEVIVVIDGSIDDTEKVLGECNIELPRFNIVKQENKGRAGVRNTGAAVAGGELLVFFDDDMLPEPECLERHVSHHIQNAGSILTGSQIDILNVGSTEIQRYRAWLTRKWSESLIATKGKPLPPDLLFITAANFSIPRDIFLKINGFDEGLTDAEDYDLAIRASKQGIQLFYDHSAFSWHNDPVSCRKYIRRMRQYRQAHKKLYVLGKIAHFSEAPTGLKGMFFRIFCHTFWIRSIDGEVWKCLLPQKWRYRLYDFVITANGSYYPESVKV